MNDASANFSQALPPAPPEEAGLLRAGIVRLEEAMRREVESQRLPGAAVLIARGGKIGYRGAFGRLRPGGPAMRSDAILRIYSMTKPITSVALMTLVEEGRLLLTDPLTKYVPAFSETKVGVERDGGVHLVPAEYPITIQDLLRHTSGLTYAHTGTSAVQRLYAKAPLRRRDITSAAFLEALAALPLLAQPGSHWNYSHSTDVLGCVIEIVSGQKLGAFLQQRVLGPLGMSDTAYFAPPDKHDRLAEPFDVDPDSGAPVRLFDNRTPPTFEMGGSGMVSTLDDYSRFCQMLLQRGVFNGVRLLGRKTIDFMTADHLGPEINIASHGVLPPGHGFGLGFAVRRAQGLAPTPGTIGEFYWGGLAGTAFFVAPKEELFAILMIQAEGQREYYRALFRNLVHGAMA
jgi:CubicO group peptidase (beta-lactamase class C family)